MTQLEPEDRDAWAWGQSVPNLIYPHINIIPINGFCHVQIPLMTEEGELLLRGDGCRRECVLFRSNRCGAKYRTAPAAYVAQRLQPPSSLTEVSGSLEFIIIIILFWGASVHRLRWW
jgi:hypothetical protein